jgi:hypothetical protein
MMNTATHRATCRTPGCGNAGHGIDVEAYLFDDTGERTATPDPDPVIVCGVCGVRIAEVIPA